jgi:hypothetical protein
MGDTDGSAGIALSRTFSGNVASATNTPPLTFTLTDTATSNQVIASISPQGAAGTGDAFSGNMRFYTANATGTNTERMRIDSGGRLMLSTTVNTNVSNNADDIVIGDLNTSNETGLTISSTAGSSIRFNDNAGYAGGLEYSHSDNTLRFSSNAAERVRIDSSGRVGIGTTSPTEELTISSATPAIKLLDTDQADSYTQISNANQDLYFSANGASAHAKFIFRSGNAGTFAERMRIDSSGRLLLGTTTEGEATAQTLTLASSSHAGITIRSGTGSSGSLYFSDGTSGADEYRGFIEYPHGNNFLKFGTNSTEKLRISADGAIGIGGANYGSSGQVLTSGGSGSAPAWADAAGGGATPVVITANRTAVASDYVFVNASGLTVTLPSSPSAGDSVKVRIIGTNYATIARNSSNIESVAENFYHDLADKCATFTYANSSLGWQVGC